MSKIILLLLFLTACDAGHSMLGITKEEWVAKRGYPVYEVKLISKDGTILQTKQAHQYHESHDIGPNTNYQFTTFYWRTFRHSDTYGSESFTSWEWPMTNVIIIKK